MKNSNQFFVVFAFSFSLYLLSPVAPSNVKKRALCSRACSCLNNYHWLMFVKHWNLIACIVFLVDFFFFCHSKFIRFFLYISFRLLNFYWFFFVCAGSGWVLFVFIGFLIVKVTKWYSFVIFYGFDLMFDEIVYFFLFIDDDDKIEILTEREKKLMIFFYFDGFVWLFPRPALHLVQEHWYFRLILIGLAWLNSEYVENVQFEWLKLLMILSHLVFNVVNLILAWF